eukprot:752989-Hanusia_phi.AAC.4
MREGWVAGAHKPSNEAARREASECDVWVRPSCPRMPDNRQEGARPPRSLPSPELSSYLDTIKSDASGDGGGRRLADAAAADGQRQVERLTEEKARLANSDTAEMSISLPQQLLIYENNGIDSMAQEIERLNRVKDALEEELRAYQDIHSPEGAKFQTKMKKRLKVPRPRTASHSPGLQELENQLDAAMNNEIRLRASLHQKDAVSGARTIGLLTWRERS